MKRPRKNKEAKYMLKQICNADVLLYVKEIDRYCDELEKELFSCRRYNSEILINLKRGRDALDKACNELKEITETCPYYLFNFCNYKNNCNNDQKKCWKEWCLKDE